MDETELLEIKLLEAEYNHLLNYQAVKTIGEIKTILENIPEELFRRNHDVQSNGQGKRLLLSNPNIQNQAKCMVLLEGDCIIEADLAIKLQKNNALTYQSRIGKDNPWQLQQIQDTANQLSFVLDCIENFELNQRPINGKYLMIILDELLFYLKCAYDHLMMPKRKTLEELVKNPQNRCFHPQLPNELVLSFYIQGSRLILSIYHLFTNQANRVDIANRIQFDFSITWLNDVLFLITAAMHACQQLKDKLTMFVNLNVSLISDSK